MEIIYFILVNCLNLRHELPIIIEKLYKYVNISKHIICKLVNKFEHLKQKCSNFME